jgi:RNA polymerase sigma-70 factor (ECF subfamily)
MKNEAFEQAVTMHKDRVHSYAAMMLRDATEAQDVAQEAMVRLWQNRGQVVPEAARPWLMRTTHNLCIDRLRKRKVRGEIDDAETVMERKADANPGPRQLAESGQLGELIEKALGSLAAMDRAVLVMREVQGLPYDEIAKTLDLPLGTLKARLHRARERLRGKLSRIGVTPWAKPNDDAA